MSQLLLTAKDGYAFSGATGGPVTAAVPQLRGGHGYLNSDPDLDALFIASGYGVRANALPGGSPTWTWRPPSRNFWVCRCRPQRQAPAAPVIVWM